MFYHIVFGIVGIIFKGDKFTKFKAWSRDIAWQCFILWTNRQSNAKCGILITGPALGHIRGAERVDSLI